MHSTLTRVIAGLCWTWTLVVLVSVSTRMSHADETSTTEGAVDFERDIQPILAARCLKCHGSGEAEASLKLNERASALEPLESGTTAIVPGNPAASELLRRVLSADESERMPPEGPALDPSQIAKLRAWITTGANWPAHWAYQPLHKPATPTLKSTPTDPDTANWALTPIDRFILKSLVERGLTPSPQADKRTLLRRVAFDLTGLPPTTELLDAFLADDDPLAYERAVDVLLASPRYGERWARHWMDLVHYAETHGHDQDRPRENAWPYRDYLIRSFNSDKPYARFVEEQLAGDVLYPNDPWAIVATGFLATGPWDESSLRDIREDSIDREIARYIDRDDIVTTVMATFASSTVHCARCHDHKFDPISQAEYYGLQAVFAGIDKANRAYDPDPQVAARRQDLIAQQQHVAEMRRASADSVLADELLADALQAEVADWEQSTKNLVSIWKPLTPTKFSSRDGSTLTLQEDGSLLASGEVPDKEVYTIIATSNLPRITGVRLEVIVDDTLPEHGPGRAANGNLHLNEFIMTVVDDADETNMKAHQVVFSAPQADFNQEGWTIAMAVDNNPATAWGIYPAVGKSHRAVFPLKTPLDPTGPVKLKFELQQVHGGSHLIGRPRLSVTDAPLDNALSPDVVPANISEILAIDAKSRTDDQRRELAGHFLDQKIARELADLPPQAYVYCGTNHFEADGSFRPTPAPRPVHILQRGEISKPLSVAQPGALSCVSTVSVDWNFAEADEGARRAALADWMTDPQNPLTWRSIVNRVWLYHLGQALVTTPNDFGQMGESPSHPELLDWLAVTLQENGGSLKSLHRMIVTSAVYRQSSQARVECEAVDSDNRYLWRMNRRRLDAESIHDALLQISKTLDTQMAGPSVRQFIQTPGIHVTPNVDYANFDVDDSANHRRSIYRFVFRTLPDPFMEALDCPDASQLTPKRSASFTALQALAMLNNKFVVRQSERLADRLTNEANDLPTQIDLAFRWIFGRQPSSGEIEAVDAYVTTHGWPNACRFLLNTNEFIFVD